MPNQQATVRTVPLLLGRCEKLARPPFPAKQGLGLLDAVDQLARLVRPPGRAAAVRQLESGPSRLCRGILGVGV